MSSNDADVVLVIHKGFTYVGELCRFLLAQPASELDQKHSIRFASGNGLRQNLWMPFVKRFNITHVYEFYAATESNAYFCNTANLFQCRASVHERECSCSS